MFPLKFVADIIFCILCYRTEDENVIFVNGNINSLREKGLILLSVSEASLQHGSEDMA